MLCLRPARRSMELLRREFMINLDPPLYLDNQHFADMFSSGRALPGAELWGPLSAGGQQTKG